MQILFIITLFIILYHIFIYKQILRLIIFVSHKNNNKNLPANINDKKISVIISAYNEEKNIKNRINNILDSNFPSDRLEIIVVNDCSDDNTLKNLTQIKKEKNLNNLIIIDNETRKGKTGSLNYAVQKASNDFLLFTDANTVFEKDVPQKLISAFNDKKIGGVRGTLIVKNLKNKKSVSNIETNYWNNELEIIKLESKIDSTIAFPGAIYMIRKELFSEIPTEFTIMDDFYEALKILEKNYKIIYREDALAYEYNSSDSWGEYKRKIRIATANFNIFKETIKILIKGKFSWKRKFFMFSHKILRWILPFLYILYIILSFILLYSEQNTLYKIIVLLNSLQLYLSLLGFIFEFFKITPPFAKILRLNLYFILMVIASIKGFIKSFQDTKPYWNRIDRQA